MRLTELPRPFLVAVVCEPEPDALAAAMESSARAGAAAIELNLAQIRDRDLAHVRRLARDSSIPVYTACRRAAFMRVYGIETALPELNDAARMERQLEFSTAACALDIELDTFAEAGAPLEGMPPGCREIVRSSESIERQRRVIEAAHAANCDAIVSCHTGVPLSACQTLLLAREIQSRGADGIKIVQRHDDPTHPAELWKSAALLRRESGLPFVLLSTGPGDALWRRLACHFGCSWTFTRAPGARFFYPGHPPLEEMTAFWKCLSPGDVL